MGNRPAWQRYELGVILAAIAAFALLTAALSSSVGCARARLPAVLHDKPPVAQPPPTPPAAVSATAELDHRIAELQGQLEQAKAERIELRLAPIRTSLRWAEGLAALAIVAGIGLAIAARIWGLGIGCRGALGIAGLGAGVLLACLATNWALDHLGWILAALGTVAAAAAVWAWRTHRSLARIGEAGVGAAHRAYAALEEDGGTARVASLREGERARQLASGIQGAVQRQLARVRAAHDRELLAQHQGMGQG